MKLKFWGTRGSLPVAISVQELQNKLADALLAGGGRLFKDRAHALAFIEKELPFEIGSGFGGNTSCVEVRTGHEEYLLCDAGSGLRVFGDSVMGPRAWSASCLAIWIWRSVGTSEPHIIPNRSS